MEVMQFFLLLLKFCILQHFCESYCCCTCSSLKDTRSSMEVNWLNTMALAEGSACSILCTSSLRASILVLLWKSVVLMRLRMLLFLLLRALTGDCSTRMY